VWFSWTFISAAPLVKKMGAWCRSIRIDDASQAISKR